MESLKAAANLAAVDEDFSTEEVKIKPQTPLEVLGKTSSGLVSAKLGEETVYVCETEMSLKHINDYNKSQHACRIIAALEMSKSDSQVATKIAISNPLSKEDCSDTLKSLYELLQKDEVHSIKTTFTAILKALLDIRVRLPPIFYINPKLILVDTVSFECKIIVDHEMFKRESERPTTDFSIDNLRYLSPEEIKN